MVLDKHKTHRLAEREEREHRLVHLIARLRTVGFRITPQRRAVLQALIFSERHPGAEELYQEVRTVSPSMSRATVYKTLDMLRRAGEVLELEFRDGGRGANRYDGRLPFPHPHLVCIECGAVEDAVAGEVVSALAGEAAAAAGYEVQRYRLDIYGRCPACRSKAEASAAANGQ